MSSEYEIECLNTLIDSDGNEIGVEQMQAGRIYRVKEIVSVKTPDGEAKPVKKQSCPLYLRSPE